MTSPGKPIQSAIGTWLAPLLFILTLGLALWVMTRAWDASLLDRHQFRQTQTALSTYWLQRDGFKLAYPTPIFGPPWTAPMEFPLYQILVAHLSTATGLPLVSAARLVGIAFFLGLLPAIYGLAREVEPDRRRRLLLLAAVLTVPVCLFYARTFMIESCAATLAAWYLYAHVRSLQKAGWGWLAAATALAVLAALVKITTFVLFVPVVIVCAYSRFRQGQHQTGSHFPADALPLLAKLAAPVVPALVTTLAWVEYGDALKRANPLAAMLTSANLSHWNYGDLAQRLDPAFWERLGVHFSQGVFSVPSLILLLTGALLIGPHYRRTSAGCAAGYLVGPLLFSNLYFIHDYYQFGAALFAAAAAGIVLAGLIETPRIGPVLKGVFLVVFVALQGLTFHQKYAQTLIHPPSPPPALVDVVRESVPPDGIILIYGWDWNALIPYYAQRRVIMVPAGEQHHVEKLEEVVRLLGTQRIAAMIMQSPLKHEAGFVRWRTEKFSLAPQPVARSQAGDLYLPPAAIAPLKARLAGALFHDVRFNFEEPALATDPRLQPQPVSPAAYASIARPAPMAAFSPWLPSPAIIEGDRAILANAPAELHFTVPAGATRIEASFGLLDSAYAPPNNSDGVEVIIYEKSAAGRRELFRRHLNPRDHPADRGRQKLVLEPAGALHGTLVFAFLAGPADNLACDWSYWSQIEIH